MSSPATTPMSQVSTKLSLDIPTGDDDWNSLRKRTVERVNAASTPRDILLFLVAYRILNALSVRTFFQPDEFFQALEPAWEIAFGADSGAWITWVSKHLVASQRRKSLTPHTGVEKTSSIRYPAVAVCSCLLGFVVIVLALATIAHLPRRSSGNCA